MLALDAQYRYGIPAGAKSSAGIDSPNTSRRTSAPSMPGAFFVPAMRYGGGAWDAFERAGFLECRSVNPRTVAHPSIDSEPGDSTTLGVTIMTASRLFPTRTRSTRAAAHRAMAKAALFADSSAAVRLKRYNNHMDKARHLEAQEVQS